MKQDTKTCLRSGGCCSGYFAVVPKFEDSDLSPEHIESIGNFKDTQKYIEENSESMGAPCKWLIRDEQTTEATCQAHTRKSSMCIDYPEHITGSEYCNMGINYWSRRKKQNLPIPEWIDVILTKGDK